MRAVTATFLILLASPALAADEPDPGTRIILQKDTGDARLVLEQVTLPEVEAPKEGVSVGVRGRYVTVPSSLFDVWLLDHTAFNSYSVGLEIGIDGPAGGRVIFGIDYTDLSMPPGNFRGDGDFPDQASFTEVDLHLIALEALFLWHLDFSDWVGLTYGIALGVGYVPGTVTSTDVLPTCTHPVADCGHWNRISRREQILPPDYYPTRFVPLLGLQSGLYFRIADGFLLRLDVGARLAMIYTGLTARATF